MNLDFRFYWTLFLRRLPAMAAVFLLCAGIGVALAFKLPTTYSSQARIRVEEPLITGLEGIGGSRGGEHLETIQNALMTRANLIDIANDLQVFGRNHGMNPDQVVAAMRAATDIDRKSGRNRATTMTVGFNTGNPRMAANVVNKYLDLILEENARQQNSRTGVSLNFFSQEVERLDRELAKQSGLILVFKQANGNALPDNLTYSLNRESFLQERVARTERRIDEINAQRQRAVEIFEATGRLPTGQKERMSPEEQKLAKLNAQLEGMRLRFSDTNPRVAILLSQIAQLEAQVAAAGGATQAEVSQETIFDLTMSQVDAQVEELDEERARDMEELATLRTAIEATGENAIKLDALQRNYNNAQSQYNAAIERRDNAQLNENANNSGYIGRISTIEPPTVPNSPSSPNRPLVAMGGVGVGLLGMAGLFVLLEILNRTIRRPFELTKSLGVIPMATIPYMQTRKHFWVRRTLKLLLLIAVIIAVPLALLAIDTYYKPLDLIYDGLLRQLGL